VSKTLLFENRLLKLLPHLNEKQKRLAAALEAKTIGYGGVSKVSRATGMDCTPLSWTNYRE